MKHRHTFQGQTLEHDHPHTAPHGYYGHEEDPEPHAPSEQTGTYDIPFNRQAAKTVDDYVAKCNRRDAIAEATKLPPLTLEDANDPNRVQFTPQASAVSWALWVARKEGFNPVETLVLVALAQHAYAATWSGNGYSYSTAEDIAALLPGFTASRVRTVMRPGETRRPWRVVEERDNFAGLGWRIPNDALDGKWLDRAARNTHYGKATDAVRR